MYICRDINRSDPIMRKVLSLLFAVVLLSCCGGAQDGEPKLFIVGPKAFDFGTVSEPTAYREWEVEVLNIGSGKLVLNEVQRSCNCLKAEFERRPLKHGDRMKIKIIMDNRGCLHGHREYIIRLITNEKDGTHRIPIRIHLVD